MNFDSHVCRFLKGEVFVKSCCCNRYSVVLNLNITESKYKYELNLLFTIRYRIPFTSHDTDLLHLKLNIYTTKLASNDHPTPIDGEGTAFTGVCSQGGGGGGVTSTSTGHKTFPGVLHLHPIILPLFPGFFLGGGGLYPGHDRMGYPPIQLRTGRGGTPPHPEEDGVPPVQ